MGTLDHDGYVASCFMFPIDEVLKIPGSMIFHMYSFDLKNAKCGWGKIPVFSETQFRTGGIAYDTSIEGDVTKNMFLMKELRLTILDICASIAYKVLAPRDGDVFFFLRPATNKLKVSGSSFTYENGCKVITVSKADLEKNLAFIFVKRNIKGTISTDNLNCIEDTLALLSIMAT